LVDWDPITVKLIEAAKMAQPSRRMNLSDAMILVAVTGAALGIARGCLLYIMLKPLPSYAARLTVVFVALALTISLIPLRFRQPRPRRPGRHPGTVACCAVAMALMFILVREAISWLHPVPSTYGLPPHYRAVNFIFNLDRLDLYSLAVAGAWLALALSGRWRPEPDWLDRAGRVLGLLWIVSPLLLGLVMGRS
jgi:hypothetical protein